MLRLSICLLLSVGLHGGAAFYEWASSPAESGLAHAPVVVSLLPAAEVPAAVSTGNPRQQQNPVPAPERLRAATAAQPVSVPELKSLPSAKARINTTPTKAARARDDVPTVRSVEANTGKPSDETVCMTPRQVASDGVAELYTDIQPEIASAQGVETRPGESGDVPRTWEKGPRGSDVLPAVRSSLVEAVPRYRDNPLPDYPYIARQKHWQGVVWLLVDVSAKGLVDDVGLEQSCGYRVLDRAASRAVQRWEFAPATRNGLPVSSQVRIPVRFSLEDS